jgi:hypothetical protein
MSSLNTSQAAKQPWHHKFTHDFGLLFSIGNILLVAGNLPAMSVMAIAAATIMLNKIIAPKINPITYPRLSASLNLKANSQALNAGGLLFSGFLGLALTPAGFGWLPFCAAISYGLAHSCMAAGSYWEYYGQKYPLSATSSAKRRVAESLGKFCQRQHQRITPGFFGIGYVFVALIAQGWVFQGLACISAACGFVGAAMKKDSAAYRMFAASGCITAIAHGTKAIADLARGDLLSAGREIYCASYTVLFSAGEYRLSEITKPAIATTTVYALPTTPKSQAQPTSRPGFVGLGRPIMPTNPELRTRHR